MSSESPVQIPHGSRQPYTGDGLKLAIAIDFGSANSRVAFALLRHNEPAVIQQVTRYPDQTSSSPRVPSVLYYDAEGNVQEAGASTQMREIRTNAEENGWVKCTFFKLHLCSKREIYAEIGPSTLPSLPPGKSVEEVIGDYFIFIYKCATDFIQERVNGRAIWNSCKDSVNFVFTHPTGWDSEGLELKIMRRSAVYAGMVSDTVADNSRIMFVSEGEASLHYCLVHALTSASIGHPFTIVSAEDETLDVSSYEIKSPVREVTQLAASDRRFAGSNFVNRCIVSLVRAKLRGSAYDNDDTPDFYTTIRTFKDDTRPQWVSIGGKEDVTDSKLNIRKGMLKVTGKEIARCFDVSICEAVASMLAQKCHTGLEEMDVWILGKFGRSPWLYQQLRDQLAPHGLSVSCPKPNILGETMEGSLLVFLDSLVFPRIALTTHPDPLSHSINSVTVIDPPLVSPRRSPTSLCPNPELELNPDSITAHPGAVEATEPRPGLSSDDSNNHLPLITQIATAYGVEMKKMLNEQVATTLRENLEHTATKLGEQIASNLGQQIAKVLGDHVERITSGQQFVIPGTNSNYSPAWDVLLPFPEQNYGIQDSE